MAGRDSKLEVLISAKNTADSALKDARNDVRRLERDVRKAGDQLEATGRNRVDVERLERSLDRARREAKDLASESRRLKGEIDDVGDASGRTARQMGKMHGGVQTAGGGVKGLAGGLGSMASAAGVAGAAVAAVGYAAVETAKKAWDLAGATAAYEQAGIKNQQVFGAQIKTMRKWAAAHDQEFGTSTRETLSYAASIQDLLVPMGFQRKEATGLTKDVAGIIPALQEWDKSGRDTGEITEIVTAALTGERDSLKSLGISISQNAVDAKVSAMRASGQLKGKTDEEAQAMATLALITEKSGDAIKAHNKHQDSMAARMKALKTDAANLKQGGLSVLLGVFRHLGKALQAVGIGGKGKGLEGIADWVKAHRQEIIGFVLKFISGLLRVGSVALRVGSMYAKMVGYVIGGAATILQSMAAVVPSMKGAADKASALARGYGVVSAKADAASTKATKLADAVDQQGMKALSAKKKTDAHAGALGRTAEKAGEARSKVSGLNKALDNVDGKSVSATINVAPDGSTTSTPWWQKLFGGGSGVVSAPGYTGQMPGGDSTHPHRAGVGPLPGGLAAAHASLDVGIPGTRSIVSAVRSHNLGSPGSDHLHGRALDLAGSGLHGYASAVRAAGGYAAFHGSGPQRHLHAVPGGGGGGVVHQTFNTTIHAAQTVDVTAAMRRAQMVAAQAARELGA